MKAIYSYRILLCTVALLYLMGCSQSRPYYYQATETQIETRSGLLGDNGLYHDVLYDPGVIALNFEGFIVGIDKSPRDKVTPKEDTSVTYKEPGQEGMAKLVERLTDESKSHYVSHIVWNTGKPFGEGNCYFYSIYADKPSTDDKTHELAPLAVKCEGGSINSAPQKAFPDSFDAINKLATKIEGEHKRGKKYSHVLFVVMGWNTPQIEAVRNFNSLVTNLRRASTDSGDNAFNPLFIGVTWSSYWDQTWFDALVRMASYKNKADDADEIGATWLGYLIAKVSAATPGIPKVAIGHSFGVRALSMAICMGPQFAKPETVSAQQVDLFIAMQPAVSINRFLSGGGADKIVYPKSCANASQVVITASSHDEAVKSAFWADMAGNGEEREIACGAKRKEFEREVECVVAECNGKVPNCESIKAPIIYVDASNLVFFNHPNTGGGAHSDIYRPETGAFMWQWFPQAKR
jgi:hypothetical protein